jgi:serine/threonine protein kinase
VDMWSSGCVMFEMASARPLFPGQSTSIIVTGAL